MDASCMILEVHLPIQDNSRTTQVVRAGNPVALQELVVLANATKKISADCVVLWARVSACLKSRKKYPSDDEITARRCENLKYDA